MSPLTTSNFKQKQETGRKETKDIADIIGEKQALVSSPGEKRGWISVIKGCFHYLTTFMSGTSFNVNHYFKMVLLLLYMGVLIYFYTKGEGEVVQQFSSIIFLFFTFTTLFMIWRDISCLGKKCLKMTPFNCFFVADLSN